VKTSTKSTRCLKERNCSRRHLGDAVTARICLQLVVLQATKRLQTVVSLSFADGLFQAPARKGVLTFIFESSAEKRSVACEAKPYVKIRPHLT